MPKRKALLQNFIALVFWLGLWAILARLVAKPLLLPGPWMVAKRLFQLVQTISFWRITALTLVRILLGALAAVAAGTVLAGLTERFSLLRTLFAPLLTMVKATPVASFILLFLIWIGRDILPSVIVFLMVLPVVWSNLSAGIAATDRRLLELAQVYGFSPWRTLRRVYVPSVLPYFLSACKTGFGLAWKAGVAAEVLVVPKMAIGRELYEAKLYLETVDLFAWTVVVILCSLLLEKALVAAFSALSRRFCTGGDTP
jgi:NitT/TauT family transport system permease protein